MKATFSVILIFVFASTVFVNGQTYSINKHKYDSRTYFPEYGDPYNPFVSGLCSFFVPGLGQMISGEGGRGVAFLGGYIGCFLVYGVGMYEVVEENNPAGFGKMLLGFGGALGVSIWSIVDAVKVAKVNNLYLRDLRKSTSLEIELSPYITQVNINNQIVSPIGMRMTVTF